MSEAETAVSTTGNGKLAHSDLLNEVERRLLRIGGAVRTRGQSLRGMPNIHRFAPGMYCREIRMPAGAMLTSEIHKTEHPFVVSAGAAYVYGDDGWELIQAPHWGLTKPGTRRMLIILRDMVWTTFHITDTTDVDELERELFEDRPNPDLEGAQ